MGSGLKAVVLCCLAAVMPVAARAADVTVTVTDVRDAKASIRMALYADADTFRHEAQAQQVISVSAQAGSVTGTFHDVAPGTYAVIVYHDENANGKLDMILGMFPDEGWGLSNDPTVIGPPQFDESAFGVGADGAKITVPLHY